MTTKTSYFCSNKDYLNQSSCEDAGGTWLTRVYVTQTRNIAVGTYFTQVITQMTDGPVCISCNDAFEWAISAEDPTAGGFIGHPCAANTLVQLLPNTVSGALWVRTALANKKCTVTGGSTVSTS